MRCLICLLFLLYSIQSSAMELITTSHSTANIEKFTLPKGTIYSNYKNTGTWTDNFGNYGTTICFGLIETNNLGGIKLDVICENLDKEGYKSWIILKRNFTIDKCKISEKAYNALSGYN